MSKKSKKDLKTPKKKSRLFSIFKNNDAPENFGSGKYDVVHFKGGNLRFRGLYGKQSLWLRYLVAIIVGLLLAIATQFCLKNTGLYNSGLSAVIQGFARITNAEMRMNNIDEKTATLVFNLMFWGLYFIVNLPIFIFGYKKIGRTFAKLTLVFLIVNTLVGLGLSYIPGVDKVFLLGNTIAVGNLDNTSHLLLNNNVFVENQVYVIPFWYNVPDGTSDPMRIFNPDYDPYRALFLFLYGIAYGLIMGIAYSLIYIVGGCSAGMDFISIYYASIKHKPLGGVMILVNSTCLIVGSIVGSYIPAGLINSNGFNFAFLISANLVASILSVIILGVLLNRFFPLHRLVKVEILSPKIMEIRNELFASSFTHSMSIAHNYGAYSSNEKNILWTICMYVEVPNLFNHIRTVDPDALIIVTTATDINGKIRIYRQGSIEE